VDVGAGLEGADGFACRDVALEQFELDAMVFGASL
jgi:hypothetical protein